MKENHKGFPVQSKISFFKQQAKDEKKIKGKGWTCTISRIIF